MPQDTLIEIKAEGKCFLANTVESCASPAEQLQQILQTKCSQTYPH
jgi:hypothetical protein